jgi:PAS domain S-box-containing protein
MRTVLSHLFKPAHYGTLANKVFNFDLLEIERRKMERTIYLNVVQIPVLRLLGFLLLSICILIHDLYFTKSFSLVNFSYLTSSSLAYAFISWIILYTSYLHVKLIDLGVLFLMLDISMWTLIIYFTGGEKSLFFFLMTVRAADQLGTTFKKVMFFGHLSLCHYLFMLVYLIYVEQRPIAWVSELPKLIMIYALNLYIALTARTTEQNRNRTAAAIRMARDLIQQLDEKSRQLAESKAHVEQLSRQNALLLSSAGEGIYGLDGQGKTIFVNPATTSISGYAEEELLDRPMHAVLHYARPDGSPYPWESSPIFATLATGTVHRVSDEVLWRKDGTSLPIEYVSTPIREEEAIIGAVVTFNDITERKAMEKALMEAKQELESKVEQRTAELQQLNAQLLTDIAARQRAEEALAAEARFLRTQTAVAEVALSSLRPEDLGPPLLETIGRAQGYAYGGLWRLSEDGHTVRLVASFGEGTAPFIGLTQDLSGPHSLVSQIIRTGQPAFSNRVQETPFGAHPITHSLQAEAVLGLPLVARTGRVVGCMTFADTENPERFTDHDLTQGVVLANQVAQALENSELFSQVNRLQEQYRVVTDALNDAVFTLDAYGRFTLGNAAGERLTGYRLEEVLGRPFTTLVAPEDLPIHLDRFYRALSGEAISPHVELEMVRKDGSRVPIELSMANLILDGRIAGRVGVARDITERRRADAQIKASLQEKEVLLREIHHRVKNNLQIISSLLNLQSRHIKDPHVIQMFRESQNRVRSMALIHENLYQSADMSRIDFAEYARNLATQLFRSYGVNPKSIALRIHASNIFLDVNTAIPCGLIINELVSNSLKYAFPDGKEGEIYIDVSYDHERKIRMLIGDNGIGLATAIEGMGANTLGLKLVTALINQLSATLTVDHRGGTRFCVTFAPQKL